MPRPVRCLLRGLRHPYDGGVCGARCSRADRVEARLALALRFGLICPCRWRVRPPCYVMCVPHGRLLPSPTCDTNPFPPRPVPLYHNAAQKLSVGAGMCASLAAVSAFLETVNLTMGPTVRVPYDEKRRFYWFLWRGVVKGEGGWGGAGAVTAAAGWGSPGISGGSAATGWARQPTRGLNGGDGLAVPPRAWPCVMLQGVLTRKLPPLACRLMLSLCPRATGGWVCVCTDDRSQAVGYSPTDGGGGGDGRGQRRVSAHAARVAAVFGFFFFFFLPCSTLLVFLRFLLLPPQLCSRFQPPR